MRKRDELVSTNQQRAPAGARSVTTRSVLNPRNQSVTYMGRNCVFSKTLKFKLQLCQSFGKAFAVLVP